MEWDKAHQGQHQQGASSPPEMTDPEKARLARGGAAPGISPDLHAPEISSPADEAEINLHGDIEGSPFSAAPGEMSLTDAHEKEQADAADTREREVKSRNTGVSTEKLAAKDDADKPADKRPAKK